MTKYLGNRMLFNQDVIDKSLQKMMSIQTGSGAGKPLNRLPVIPKSKANELLKFNFGVHITE